MDVDGRVLEALDAVVPGFVFFSEVSARLGVVPINGADAQSEQHVEALRAALLFFLKNDGSFVGEYMGSADDPWPRDLAKVPTAVLDVWAAYSDAAEHPGVRARLHDLLWTVRHGQRPFDHLRAAVEAYRDAAQWFQAAPELVSGRLRAAESLVRAFELATSVNQSVLLADVVRDMAVMANATMDDGDDAPGVASLLIGPLIARSQWHAEARPLIDRAVDRYQTSPHVRVDFLRDLRKITANDPTKTERIDREIVQTFADAAEGVTGVAKMMYLSEAAVYARDSGLTDLHANMRIKQQGMSREDLELDGIRFPMDLPEGLLDACRAYIDQAADLEDALWRVVDSFASVLGDGTAAEGTDETGIEPGYLLLPTNKINLAGPVLVHLDGVEWGPERDRRIIRLELTGLLVAVQLDHIWYRFEPSAAELARSFTCGSVAPAERMLLLARAFRAYWQDDDIALFLALPLVEGLLRRYLKAQDTPIIRLAKGESPGVVTQLGGLIEKLADSGLLPGWAEPFRLLLADPAEGPNLRNVIAHDVWTELPQRPQVALVFLVALVLLHAARTTAGAASNATGAAT